MATREDWMRRLGPLYGGAVALVHSTSWRWPDAVGHEARSPVWIVVLGLPIGLVAWLVAAIARGIGLPAGVAGVLGLAMLAVASAALVERGLAERLDLSQTVPTRAAGTVAITLYTVVRVMALAAIPPAHWLGVLVATAVAGRWGAALLQALGDPVLDDAAPRSLVAMPAPALTTASLSAGVLIVVVLALGKAGLAALALAAAAIFVLGLDAQHRDGRLTAPVVACAAAIGELCVLLSATA